MKYLKYEKSHRKTEHHSIKKRDGIVLERQRYVRERKKSTESKQRERDGNTCRTLEFRTLGLDY